MYILSFLFFSFLGEVVPGCCLHDFNQFCAFINVFIGGSPRVQKCSYLTVACVHLGGGWRMVSLRGGEICLTKVCMAKPTALHSESCAGTRGTPKLVNQHLVKSATENDAEGSTHVRNPGITRFQSRHQHCPSFSVVCLSDTHRL